MGASGDGGQVTSGCRTAAPTSSILPPSFLSFFLHLNMVEGDSKGVTAPESAPNRVQARENRPQARSGAERVALNRVQVP